MGSPNVCRMALDLQDRYLTVRGVKLRYRPAGKGEPILLLHGLGASLEQWEWSQPGLSSRHEVVALDSARIWTVSISTKGPIRLGSYGQPTWRIH